MSWEWEPLVSVGPIRFGSDSDTLKTITGLRLEEMKRSDRRLWSHYWSDDAKISVMCVDRRVVSVACHETLRFEGGNLIGLLEAESRMRFRDRTPAIGEFPDGHTLEFADLGLELTIENGRVLIATAFDEPLG